jgi:hypothetical protein
MAEGDGTIHNHGKFHILNGDMALGTGGDTIKVALCSGAVPSVDGSLGIADCTQLTGGTANYVVKTLASQTVAQVDASDRAQFDGANITWTALGTPNAAITYTVMYDDTISADPIIATWELTTQPNGGDYTLQWHTDGVVLLT